MSKAAEIKRTQQLRQEVVRLETQRMERENKRTVKNVVPLGEKRLICKACQLTFLSKKVLEKHRRTAKHRLNEEQMRSAKEKKRAEAAVWTKNDADWERIKASLNNPDD